MNKKYVVIGLCCLLYLAASFIAFDFSPSAWPWYGRLLLVIAWCSVFCSIFENEIDAYME